MSETTCTLPDRDELALAYSRDRLDEGARDAYENHLTGCAVCQNEVLLAATVRAALRPRARWVRRRAAAVGVLALAAAALVMVAVLPRGTDTAALAALGGLDAPPVYLGVPVRGTASADSALDLGLRLYDQGRWAEARMELGNAEAMGAPADLVAFFAGAASLMEGRAADAERSFAAVLRAGDGPYVPEAHYYRAKALLRLRRPAEALDELKRVRDGSAASAMAAALADSMRALGVR